MTKSKSKPRTERSATTFYSDTFTTEELALVAQFVSDPALDDELWAQRVANRRLIVYANKADIPLAELVKVVEALAIGTGRVARLLRDRRALSGEAAEGLTGALANALDELGTELGLDL